MENTPHVCLMGLGANEFALKMGFETVSDEYLLTSDAKNALDKFFESGSKFITTEIGE